MCMVTFNIRTTGNTTLLISMCIDNTTKEKNAVHLASPND